MSHFTDEDPDLLDQVLLPIAHADDALTTATTLEPDDPSRVTALHVVEKGEGVPDKTPVEQAEEVAANAFGTVRSIFPDTDHYTVYARDIVTAIFETADENDASAITYRPRGGNRLARFLSDDLSLKLVTRANIPVICLPRTDANE
ncbi:MAG: universal stress protein [Halobacteriota archaeon]